VRALGLDEPPEAFQGSVSAEPVTTVVLRVNVSAPDDESAVRRVNALTREYLDFRAAELRSLSSGTISGYKSRITTMQEQVLRDHPRLLDRGRAPARQGRIRRPSCSLAAASSVRRSSTCSGPWRTPP